jgi:cell wall-associated NlpC family hydrolase
MDPEMQFIQCSGLVVYLDVARHAESRMITQLALKIRRFALIITMLGLMSACASQPDPVPDSRAERAVQKQPGKPVAKQTSNFGQKAAAVALRQVGVPYLYGGSTTSGFDCSGLVQYAYRQAGKSVPRTTRQLWSATNTIRRDELEEGDLLFFSIEGKMSHVGMYLGREQFVHAPSSGRTVTIEQMKSPFYANALIRAGRPK